jgi:hypothetical protein
VFAEFDGDDGRADDADLSHGHVIAVGRLYSGAEKFDVRLGGPESARARQG